MQIKKQQPVRKTVNVPQFSHVAIGSKGVAFAFTPPAQDDVEPRVVAWPRWSKLETPPAVCNQRHASGKPCGVPQRDEGRFVSERGEASQVLSLTKALKQGLVQKVTLTLLGGGKVKAYAHRQFKTAGKFNAKNHGQYFAAPNLPAGRTEAVRVHEAKERGGGCRNAATYLRHVAVAAGW